MSKLSQQAGFLSLADFLRFFIKTLIGIALARLLSPADLGSYRQLFLIYSTLSGILMLGFPQSMLYFIPKAKSPDEVKRLVGRTINVISLLALVCALLILATRNLIAESFSNPDLSRLLIIYSLYPIFLFVTQLYSSVLLGLKEPLRSARFTIFAILCDLIIVLGIALWTRDIVMITFGVVISAFIQWLWAALRLRQYRGDFGRDSFAGFKEQLYYTIPLGLSLLIGVLSVQLDKLMISGFFKPEDFAVFSLGAMELPLIGILINSVNAILLPNLSSVDKNQLSSMYSASIRKNALIIFPLASVFFIFATEFMVFIYGAIYAEAAVYFRIYLLLLPLRVATYGIVFQAMGRTKLVMIDAVIMLVLNAGLNLFLIRIWGMRGAAYATVMVSWLILVVYLLQMRFQLGLRLLALFPILRLLKTLAVAILAAILTLISLSPSLQGFWRLALGSILYFALYVPLAFVSKVLLPCDLILVRDFSLSLIQRLKK